MPAAAQPVVDHARTILFAPGERFLVRRVPLDPTADVTSQVELALETLSPFPLAQLYHGYIADPEHRSALIYAAFRRNFSAEETAGWSDAWAVLPDFAAALRPATKPPAGSVAWRSGGRIAVAAWDGASAVPALVQVRAGDEAAADGVVAEARRRAGLDGSAAHRASASVPETVADKRGVTVRLPDAALESGFDLVALRAADIRDRAVVAARERRVRQDRLTWGVFSGILAMLAACLALEVGLVGLGRILRSARTEQESRQPAVARIQAAHGLAGRLEQVSAERLMPFEMLAALNARRPASIEFTRVTTGGAWQLQIDGQTANVRDLSDYESELRRLAPLERVGIRDQRTRDGLTTFTLEVSFKPGWAREGGA